MRVRFRTARKAGIPALSYKDDVSTRVDSIKAKTIAPKRLLTEITSASILRISYFVSA